MSTDIYKWNTAKDLAAWTGYHVSAVRSAARNGALLGGCRVESRPATPADQTTARKLYRVVRDEVEPRPVDVETAEDEAPQATDAEDEPEHDVDELLADLAGCEAHIEELEAQNDALQKRIDEGDFGAIAELRDALRQAGISELIGPRDAIQSLLDIIEAFRAQAAESERKAAVFLEEARTAFRDLNATSTERDEWKTTAQALAKTVQRMDDKYFDLLEKFDRKPRGLRRVVSAVRRVVEVVR